MSEARAATPAIKKAYADVLRAGAELIGAWLQESPERVRELHELEARGLRPGLLMRSTGERVEVAIVLTDQAGGIEALETIEHNVDVKRQ
jgi:hypothetical protein